MTDRDERLGHGLRALDVPDHGPDFFPRLTALLDQEPGPDRQERRRRPSWQPPIFMGLAAAAVLIAIIATSTMFADNGQNLIRPTPPEPRLINATEVRARVSTALSSLRTLSGEVAIERLAPDTSPSTVANEGGRTTQRWSFHTTAAGDERITGIGSQDDLSYSASRREQRVVSDSGRPPPRVHSNLPPGPPDFTARTVLSRDVASVVRAFLDTTEDVPVTEVTEQGRAAWRLTTFVVPNKVAGPGRSADQLEVIVDRQSGFPLRITETLAGRFLSEVRLSNLVVDGPVDPALFVLDMPAGVQPFRQDGGFRSVALGEVADIVGYRPLLPAAVSLPPGYALAEVTVRPERGGPTGNEGGNPPSRNVVSVAYRRGFDRIIVTTRSVDAARPCRATPPGSGNVACWSDPLASGEGFLDQPERYTVAGGALAGAQAELLISPRGVPHVWTIDDRLVVTVAGDASAEELRRLSESFSPSG